MNLVKQEEPVDIVAWKTRTDIVLTKGGSGTKLNMGSQNSTMRDVLRESFEIGRRYLAFGIPGDEKVMVEEVANLLTPMAPAGLNRLCLRALIAAAEGLGFEGEFDVADRLERGSEKQYISPLVNHVRSYPLMLFMY